MSLAELLSKPTDPNEPYSIASSVYPTGHAMGSNGGVVRSYRKAGGPPSPALHLRGPAHSKRGFANHHRDRTNEPARAPGNAMLPEYGDMEETREESNP